MKTLIISLKIFLFFTILTGIIYPIVITLIGQVAFRQKVNGSLIVEDKHIIGSKLIGQQFDTTIYFSGRPSSISYNPLPSGGSNYSVTNIKLKKLFEERKKQFIKINQLDSLTIVPSEMLSASGSGLDPHISPEGALLQLDRIVFARHFDNNQKAELIKCIKDITEPPQFSCLGEKRINVLNLNLQLNEIEVNKGINK